jgi:hypothetical protein
MTGGGLFGIPVLPVGAKELIVTLPNTKEEVEKLARRPRCPRCDLDKTFGSALCRSCRSKLPAHMRARLERIPAQDASAVVRAIRSAANYFNVHFQSVRNFGGGRKR